MTKTAPVHIESILEHNLEQEDVLLSVIINGEFKTMVFYKIDGENYIIIGDTSAYKAACYWNSASVTGYSLIEGIGEWYETTEEESAAIYKKVAATQKINKKGRPYYRFSF